MLRTALASILIAGSNQVTYKEQTPQYNSTVKLNMSNSTNSSNSNQTTNSKSCGKFTQSSDGCPAGGNQAVVKIDLSDMISDNNKTN